MEQRDAMGSTPREETSDRNSDPLRHICHEISGPLTSILVQCDLLLDVLPAPGLKDLRARIESIQEEALRISKCLRAASR